MTDRYQIISPLGACGCGAVFRGWDASQNRDVIITRYPIAGQALEEFSQNVRKLNGLRHANLVRVLDSGTDEEGGYVITEMIKGDSLEKRVADGPLSEEDFVVLTRQMLSGLAAAHDAGLLHLNLKPDNILLPWNSGGTIQIKITGFNLAPSAGAQDGSQRALHFMAPEQFGKAFVDARTDLYVAGALSYYALTRQHPFEGADDSQVIVAHLYHRISPLTSLRPDLPTPMCAWVERLMSQDIKDRPATASEALRIFDAIVQQVSAVLATPVVDEEDVPVLAQDDDDDDDDDDDAETAAVVVVSDAEYPFESAPRHLTKVTPRSRKNSALPFVIAAFIIAVVGMLAFISYVKYSHRGERQQRFVELSASEHPEGSELDVRILFDYLDDPTTRDKAGSALTKLQGGDFIDEMIVAHLREIRQKTACAKLTEIIGQRRIAAAFPDVLPLVHDHVEEVRKAAWKTLGKITQPNSLLQMIEGIRHTPPREHELIERSIAAVVEAAKDRTLATQIIQKAYQNPAVDAASRAVLLDALVRVGGPGTLAIITSAIADSETPVRLAAITALTDYPTHEPLAAIAARLPKESDSACRIYLILAATELSDKPGPSTQEALAVQVQSLYANAKTPDEKKRALAAAGRVIAGPTATFYQNYANATDDPDLKQEALGLSRVLKIKLAKTIAIAASSTATLLPVAAADYNPDGEMSRRDGILTGWKHESDWASWLIEIPQNGEYEITIHQAHAGDSLGTYEILLAGQTLLTSVVKTAGDADFQGFIAGRVNIPQPGTYRVLLRPKTMPEAGELFAVKSLGIKLR